LKVAKLSTFDNTGICYYENVCPSVYLSHLVSHAYGRAIPCSGVTGEESGPSRVTSSGGGSDTVMKM